MSEIKLNPAQRRSVTIVLMNFEKQLRHAQYWLQGYEENAFLYKRYLQISETQKRKIKDKIENCLVRLEQLATDLDLEQSEENVASLIRGEFSISWADLVDLQSRKLKRYGKTDPSLAKNFDPDIRELARTAFELSTILNQGLPVEDKKPLLKDKLKTHQE